MTTLNTYLTFDGNCETAFEFYKSVFGGEFQHIARYDKMPSEHPIPESQKEKIMHISLPVGETTVLMGSDSSEEFGKATNVGNNFSISINTDDLDEANRLFTGLSENGKVTMPMNKTFWGAYFGMFTDQFGIQWMVNCDLPQEK